MSVGFDMTTIARYENFKMYSVHTLSRIFSESELGYCLADKQKSAQRFAVRFAAKEAFYKALVSSGRLQKTPSFFHVCRAFSLVVQSGLHAIVDWKSLVVDPVSVSLSVSHEKGLAGAVVLLSWV